MRLSLRLASRLAAILALSAAPAAAQPATHTVTRRDLADAYLEVDRLVTRFGIPDRELAGWNRTFDRTTLAFFGGDFARVLRDMHDLTARIVGDSAPGSPTRQALRLRVEAVPRVLTPADSVLQITATVLYDDATLREAHAVTLEIRDAAGRVRHVDWFAVTEGATAGKTFTHTIPRRALGDASGTLLITVGARRTPVTRELRVAALATRADSLRTELERALQGVPASVDPQAMASVEARLTLLADRPDPANSAQFLADLGALVPQLRDEVRALAAGRNPFVGRRGDTWRVLRGSRSTIPMRVVVPTAADSGRRPLVIAFHGAGADENMFFTGYGRGTLAQLADSLGFIAVAPATVAFAGDPGAMDSLLATLTREQRIDRSRVYVLGHSLGGAVTLQTVASRPDVRAAVVMAGAGVVPPGATLPPTLFLAAREDLVIPLTRTQGTYDTLRARSLSVSLEIVEGWGHTLIVGAQLPRALHWLLAR